MTARNRASKSLRPRILAGVLLTFFSTAAGAAIKLPGGPGGIGDGPVLDPGDWGGGGGGGGLGNHSADLEARGYVCRPYFDGLLHGKRCDLTWIEPTAFTATLDVQRCDPNDSCSGRAQKVSRGKVRDNLSLWSFAFPSAAKAQGLGDVDNDGDEDVIGFSDLKGGVGSVMVGRSNGVNEFSQVPERWLSSFCGAQTQKCAIGDFSGDKKTDVVSIDSSGATQVAISNGNAFIDLRTWSSTFGTIAGRTLVADWNGDGADDLATVLSANSSWGSRGSVVVALSIPGPPVATTGSVAASQTLTPAGNLTPSGNLTAAAATAASANLAFTTTAKVSPGLVAAPIGGGVLAPETRPIGDLRPIGGVGTIGGPRVFKAPAVWISGLCPDPNECVAGDFDGNGKDDIALVRATGESYVALSTGTAFGSADNWSDRVGRNPRSFRGADLNADGKDDLVAIQIDGSLTVGFSNGATFGANVNVEEMTCGDPLYACEFAKLDSDAYPELVEIYPYGDSWLRPGDTFVSKGVEPRGFPAEPPHPPQADGDGDGIRDAADSCIFVANPGQEDQNGNGFGDVCELRGDVVIDGVVDAADRAFVVARLGTANARADVNDDGIVDAADVAIVDAEIAAPPPSATNGEPRVEIVAPRNGTFYEPWSRTVYVAGFARNVSADNGSLVILSRGYAGAPVETPAAIGPDGWFEAFVPVDPLTEVNALAAKATYTASERTGIGRAVALLGLSAAPGDFSASSLGARVQTWQLTEFAESARKSTDLKAIGDEQNNLRIKNFTITGPMGLSVAPFSDRLVIDVHLPHIRFVVEEGCTVPIDIGNIDIHVEYDLAARYLYPGEVEAKDLPGSPVVTFGSFDSHENILCTAAAAVFGPDIEAEVKEQFWIAMLADDYFSGPIDGALEERINGLDIANKLSDLGVVIGKRFGAIPEDPLGISVDMHTGFAATSMCGNTFCQPVLTNATPRTFQTRVPHPDFPLFVPGENGLGGLYDVALALSADSINQLFGAMTAQGKLAELLAARPFDLGEFATELGLAKLQTTMTFVPTLAPFLTGRPGVGGGTEVKIGQLLLEIPTVDGADKFRVAVDLKGAATFALVRDEPLLPVIWDTPGPLDNVSIQLHDLVVTDAAVIHVPRTTSPLFSDAFLDALVPEISEQSLALRYPLPDFGDVGLELLAADAKPDGGAVVFANIDPNGTPPPSNGPVLGGGVLLNP